MRSGFVLFLVALLFMLCAGCTGLQDQVKTPSYSVSEEGILSLILPDAPVSSTLLSSDGNISVEELTFATFSGNVSADLVTPPQPIAGVVWTPGAGVPASGHIAHLMDYARQGYAVLVMDVRGNGGKTPGYPFDIDRDYEKYSTGKWPQVYLIISDLIEAERYLHQRYGSLPVWIVGESNGGRYAAVASAIDPNVAGYVGISTSGFGREGDQYSGSARQFLLSIDPDVSGKILGQRPALIFHAPNDPIIPVDSGKELAKTIGQSAQFFPFNGTHGVNGEVDNLLLEQFKKRGNN